MKRSKIIPVIILLLFYVTIQAQEYKTKIDTVYFVFLKEKIYSERPVFTQFVLKNTDSLNYYISHKIDFSCKIFNYAIYVSEPNLGFIEMSKYIPKDKNKEFRLFNKKLRYLNQNFRTTKIFDKSNKKQLEISIIKIISEFWVLPFDINMINNTTESIQIHSECYKSNYFYRFRQIIKVTPL